MSASLSLKWGMGKEKEEEKKEEEFTIMGANQTFLKYASYLGQIEIVSYLLGLPAIEVNAVSILLARNTRSHRHALRV